MELYFWMFIWVLVGTEANMHGITITLRKGQAEPEDFDYLVVFVTVIVWPLWVLWGVYHNCKDK